MKSLFRSLLVWLMLLTLPFQGIASAAMLTCAHGPMQQATVAMTAPAPDAASVEGHCHEPAIDAGNQHASPHDQHDSDGRCSACADCCIGAALAPAPALIAAPSSAPAVLVALVARHLAKVDLALPERPPRFPLA